MEIIDPKRKIKKKVIYDTVILEETVKHWLEEKMIKIINKYQNDGYEVDIQYSTYYNTFTYYTALIIAYKNE